MLRMEGAPSKKSKLIGVFLFLTIEFILSSCATHFLKDSDPTQLAPEVSNLIQNSPSKESYPNADIIHLLDERIVEVSRDGRAKKIVHRVFKIGLIPNFFIANAVWAIP